MSWRLSFFYGSFSRYLFSNVLRHVSINFITIKASSMKHQRNDDRLCFIDIISTLLFTFWYFTSKDTKTLIQKQKKWHTCTTKLFFNYALFLHFFLHFNLQRLRQFVSLHTELVQVSITRWNKWKVRLKKKRLWRKIKGNK